MSSELEQWQVDLLYRARQMDDPRLIEGETYDKAQKLTTAALSTYCNVKGPLPLNHAVDQLASDIVSEEEDDVDLSALAQNPETGSADPEDVEAAKDSLAGTQPDDDESLADALRKADPDVKQTAARGAITASRLPQHSEELRQEVADALGMSSPPTAEELKEAGYGDPRKV